MLRGAKPMLEQLGAVLDHFVTIGLGYLSLDRESSSLSGGESQRTRMVRHLGSALTDVTYVFDEPTIGLHAHDVQQMNGLLQQLRDKGNTVLVVEHEPDVMAIADHVVDMGPRAGTHGGEIVYEGPFDGLAASGTLTGEHLTAPPGAEGGRPEAERARSRSGTLGCTTSGTSRSTSRSACSSRSPASRARARARSSTAAAAHEPEPLRLVDQSAIRGSRRSNPATYTGILDPIRTAFAKANGVKPALFSANSEGACPDCKGLGLIYTDLAFMAGVVSVCDTCEGRRFTDEVLEYRLRGRNISEVLRDVGRGGAGVLHREARRVMLDRLADVGLGYITLGQTLNTLSGGERQRLKLAIEMSGDAEVFVLDEPTSGLHMHDVDNLIRLLDRIVDAGRTVIVIEHNLDVVARADWVIDLGPGAGHDGGSIVFEGPPASLCSRRRASPASTCGGGRRPWSRLPRIGTMATLLRAETILTMDPVTPRARAIGIDGGRIVAIGDVEAVRRELPADAEEIDAGARTVVPGFIDAHNHYLATAESFAGLEARDVTSIAELQRRIGEFAERRPPGTWIRGHGLEWSAFAEGRLPNRRDVDEVSTTHPILLEHVSGHAILVNSLALEQRGVRDDVRDPDGGTFDRDERGRPTGIARDGATNLLLGPSVDIGRHGPNFHTELETDDGVAMLAAAAPRYFAAGLTTIADPQVSRRELGVYREAHRLGVPGPRIVAMPLSHQLEELIEIGLAGPFGDDRLRIGAMKLYTDGAITAGTAAFSEGLGPSRSVGTFYHEPDAFQALVARAHEAGWQLAIHTMGDRAYDLALGALEAAFRARPADDPRPRVEHGTFPTPPQRERMAALGVIPVTQPGSIRELGNVWRLQLGERIHETMPMRGWLDLGIRPVISSDAFVQSYRPLDTISAATHRVTPDGTHAGPHHELTIEEAVRAHTIDAARALRLEGRLGSIEVGKLADIAVIDGDLLATEPARVEELGVWLTLQDGVPAHDARSAPETGEARGSG